MRYFSKKHLVTTMIGEVMKSYKNILRSVLMVALVGVGRVSAVSVQNNFSVTPASEAPFKVIIFDLGDVVFTTEQLWGLLNVETKVLLEEYPELAEFFQKGITKKDVWNFLYEISTDIVPNDPAMLKLFPPIMANWLTGMSSEEVVQIAETYLASSHYSEGMKKVWRTLARHLFNPRTLIDSMPMIEPIGDLAYAFKVQGYQLYVLSNWDHSSWPYLQEKHGEFFKMFDGLVYSGQEKTGKPHIQIYNNLLERYNLDALQCLFIDDADHNIKAAESLGIRAVLMDSVESVYRQLQETGLIVMHENNNSIVKDRA